MQKLHMIAIHKTYIYVGFSENVQHSATLALGLHLNMHTPEFDPNELAFPGGHTSVGRRQKRFVRKKVVSQYHPL